MKRKGPSFTQRDFAFGPPLSQPESPRALHLFVKGFFPETGVKVLFSWHSCPEGPSARLA